MIANIKHMVVEVPTQMLAKIALQIVALLFRRITYAVNHLKHGQNAL